MGKDYFSNIWFADEKRIKSTFKLFALSDKGSLRIKQNSFEFRGKKSSLRMTKIRQISIVNQHIPWISLLITNLLSGVFLLVLGSQLPPDIFQPKYVFVLISIVGILGGDALALLVVYNSKWIKLEYDIERVAYLSDGSILGWGGIFGGTKKLFQKLDSHLRG